MTLFTPFELRGHVLRNRVGMSPMCQYSSVDGFATDWHVQHIGSRAAGGAGLVIMEATGVRPEGRISPGCLGIWDDAHVEGLSRVTRLAKDLGALPGIQLAHAGRKASCDLAWRGGGFLTPAQGGWQTVAPSPVPFHDGEPAPHALTEAEIGALKEAFVAGARRAVAAGFQLVEIHGAHGYLLHEFLSPLANFRTDSYGGSADNRRRLIVEIAADVRAAVGENIIVAARLSCVDWQAGGITIADSVDTARALKAAGVDLVDCSSGFVVPGEKIPFGPGYQVAFARQIRQEAGVATAAVGGISDPRQAEAIVAAGDADLVFIGRAFLKDPYWAVHAAQALGVPAPVPSQYLRGY